MSLLYDANVFDEVAKEDRNQVKKKIDWLWDNREYVKHIPLGENLSGFFKKRFGKYRILYEYDKNNNDDMKICVIGTRDTIYKDATKKYS